MDTSESLGIGWEVIDELYKNASAIERYNHNKKVAPEDVKPPPLFSISFVASLFDVSRQFIYKLVNDPGNGIEFELVNKTKKLSPKGIDQIRDHLTRKHPDKYNFNRLDKCLVVNVLNFKGGIGKTSLALILAHGLQLRTGIRKIAILDADAQASTTAYNAVNGDSDLDVLETSYITMTPYEEDVNDETFKNSIKDTNWDGIKIVPANLGVYNIEFELATFQSENEGFEFWNQMNKNLDYLRKEFDLVIIDSPPSLGFVSLNSVYAADAMLIPIVPSQLAFQSIVSFFRMLSETMASINEVLERFDQPPKKFDFVKIVNNMYEDNRSSRNVAIELQQAFGEYLMYNPVLMSQAIKDATDDYKTVYETSDTKNRETYNRCMNSVNAFIDEFAESLFTVRSRLDQGQGELDV